VTWCCKVGGCSSERRRTPPESLRSGGDRCGQGWVVPRGIRSACSSDLKRLAVHCDTRKSGSGQGTLRLSDRPVSKTCGGSTERAGNLTAGKSQGLHNNSAANPVNHSSTECRWPLVCPNNGLEPGSARTPKPSAHPMRVNESFDYDSTRSSDRTDLTSPTMFEELHYEERAAAKSPPANPLATLDHAERRRRRTITSSAIDDYSAHTASSMTPVKHKTLRERHQIRCRGTPLSLAPTLAGCSEAHAIPTIRRSRRTPTFASAMDLIRAVSLQR